MLKRIIKVDYVDGYKLKISFNNGKTKIVDLSNELKKAKNLFLDLLDVEYFKKVKCDGFTIAWPNGIDFCPDWLYMKGTALSSKNTKRKLSARITPRRRSRTKNSR